MRFYTNQHRFYCGIDLHARTMHLCILDHAGNVVFDQQPARRPRRLPRTPSLPSATASSSASSACSPGTGSPTSAQHEQIPFVLGHALYMKAIHGGKAKNDQIDADKIARLLRGGIFPLAYVYPKGMRETRDLLRRRTFLVRQRAELHHPHADPQQPVQPAALRQEAHLRRQPRRAGHRRALRRPQRAAQRRRRPGPHRRPRRRRSATLELYLTRTAKVDDVQTFHRLQTIPGIGKILALILLYEIHDIQPLPQRRQLPVLRPPGALRPRVGRQEDGLRRQEDRQRPSAVGLRRGGLSVPASAANGPRRGSRSSKKRGKAKALAILAARLGAAVYHMLRKREAFDEARFWQGRGRRVTGSSSLSAAEATHAGD